MNYGIKGINQESIILLSYIITIVLLLKVIIYVIIKKEFLGIPLCIIYFINASFNGIRCIEYREISFLFAVLCLIGFHILYWICIEFASTNPLNGKIAESERLSLIISLTFSIGGLILLKNYNK